VSKAILRRKVKKDMREESRTAGLKRTLPMKTGEISKRDITCKVVVLTLDLVHV
jgi:hypothetical protein